MAFQLKRTSQLHNQEGVRIIVYGMAGSGKTRLIPTLPSPFIISAEAGLLSIASEDIPYIPVTSYETLMDAYRFVAESHEASAFQSIAIDSISEIAERVLVHEMRTNKDGRAAYGEMAKQVTEIIRAFRDLKGGRHVYFSSKAEKIQDETGKMLYGPSMPGNKLGQQIPYLVDEVFALRVERAQDGSVTRALQCQPDSAWQAKDRSGRLSQWEAPDLGAIISKISGAHQ